MGNFKERNVFMNDYRKNNNLYEDDMNINKIQSTQVILVIKITTPFYSKDNFLKTNFKTQYRSLSGVLLWEEDTTDKEPNTNLEFVPIIRNVFLVDISAGRNTDERLLTRKMQYLSLSGKLLSEKLVGKTQDNGSNIVDEFPLETLKSILGSFYTNRKD